MYIILYQPCIFNIIASLRDHFVLKFILRMQCEICYNINIEIDVKEFSRMSKTDFLNPWLMLLHKKEKWEMQKEYKRNEGNIFSLSLLTWLMAQISFVNKMKISSIFLHHFYEFSIQIFYSYNNFMWDYKNYFVLHIVLSSIIYTVYQRN